MEEKSKEMEDSTSDVGVSQAIGQDTEKATDKNIRDLKDEEARSQT